MLNPHSQQIAIVECVLRGTSYELHLLNYSNFSSLTKNGKVNKQRGFKVGHSTKNIRQRPKRSPRKDITQSIGRQSCMKQTQTRNKLQRIML